MCNRMKLICTSTGQNLASVIPVLGTAASALTALVMAWVWPRQHRLRWPGAGYALANVSICVGYIISSTAR